MNDSPINYELYMNISTLLKRVLIIVILYSRIVYDVATSENSSPETRLRLAVTPLNTFGQTRCKITALASDQRCNFLRRQEGAATVIPEERYLVPRLAGDVPEIHKTLIHTAAKQFCPLPSNQKRCSCICQSRVQSVPIAN